MIWEDYVSFEHRWEAICRGLRNHKTVRSSLTRGPWPQRLANAPSYVCLIKENTRVSNEMKTLVHRGTRRKKVKRAGQEGGSNTQQPGETEIGQHPPPVASSAHRPQQPSRLHARRGPTTYHFPLGLSRAKARSSPNGAIFLDGRLSAGSNLRTRSLCPSLWWILGPGGS